MNTDLGLGRIEDTHQSVSQILNKNTSGLMN